MRRLEWLGGALAAAVITVATVDVVVVSRGANTEPLGPEEMPCLVPTPGSLPVPIGVPVGVLVSMQDAPAFDFAGRFWAAGTPFPDARGDAVLTGPDEVRFTPYGNEPPFVFHPVDVPCFRGAVKPWRY